MPRDSVMTAATNSSAVGRALKTARWPTATTVTRISTVVLWSPLTYRMISAGHG